MPKWKRDLVELLVKHEGCRYKPYKDSVGKLTIGVGRNLDDIGISEKEAADLLWNDIRRVVGSVWNNFHWIDKLDLIRRNVIYSMVFNLGVGRVRGFKRMIKAIDNEDYALAAFEMLDSKWAKQVGSRAIELSEMMRVGDD